MSQYDYRPDYKRHLPHCVVLERMKQEAEERERVIEQMTIPAERIKLLYEEQKRQFGRFDDELDRAEFGPVWLSQPEIATIVIDSLHFLDGNRYDLDVFCIMSNHAHVVLTPLAKENGDYHALQTIMHSLKRHTARQANKILERDGAFWQDESYDHVIRDQEEWERIVKYVLNNPMKAGLVTKWEDWPWTYLKTK